MGSSPHGGDNDHFTPDTQYPERFVQQALGHNSKAVHMRLTMKTYTDAGQLPLREVMDTLPGFGQRADSRIDSRTLGATGQTVSRPVTETREMKTKNSLANTGESHRDSSLVTTSHEKSEWRREGDSNPTKSRQ